MVLVARRDVIHASNARRLTRIGGKDREGNEYLRREGGKMEHVFLLWESSHGDHFSAANLIIRSQATASIQGVPWINPQCW